MDTAIPIYRRIAGVVLAAWWAFPMGFAQVGEAQEAEAQQAESLDPSNTDVQEQLKAVQEQVYELNKIIRGLEVKIEDDKRVSDDKAKKDAASRPKIDIGPKGVGIASADGAFEMRLRVRLFHDFGWFHQDEELVESVGDEQDGTGFRSARFQLQGKVFTDIDYKAEIDFAGETGADTPKFRDVYLQYNGIPYLPGHEFDLRAGHFKEPFSLEELIGIGDQTFIEDPLTDVFAPSRNMGVQVSDAFLGEPKMERLTAQLGIFKETDDIPSSNDSDEDPGWSVTARVTGLPWYKDEGRKLLHLGLAYSHRNPDGAILNYGVRPESRLAMFQYVNPDNLPVGFRLRDARADDVDLFAPEAAFVWGPFSLQGEYILSKVDTTFRGDADFSGYALQAAYSFTGENRPYRTDRGTFGPLIPKKPFKWRGDAEQGWGAWEVAARASHADLQDSLVRGGEHDSYTLALNWYLNPNVRVMWNYIHNEVDHDLYDGDWDAFLMRLQLDF